MVWTGAENLDPTRFLLKILLHPVLDPYLFLCPDSAIFPFVFTYNTNIQAPGGIRTRNPSKRSTADPRLGFDPPDRPACSESL